VHKGKYLPFFEGADFKVERIKRPDNKRQPATEIKNEARFVAFRLAKAGYYNGDPKKILKAPVDIIMGIIKYEAFEHDLMLAYEEIRKQENEDR
jgi:hypothetical protein